MSPGRSIAALALAAMVGGMLFFGAVMAPLVFTKLPPDVAGAFIRAAFPRYYGFVTACAAVAAAALLLRGAWAGALASAVLAAVTLWLWTGLMPHLEKLRLAGDKTAFARGHRLSVWVNGFELLAAAALLLRVVANGAGNRGVHRRDR